MLFVAVGVLLVWKRGWWVFRKARGEQERSDKAEKHSDAKPRVEAMEKERAELPVNEQSQEVTGSQPEVEIAGIHNLHELHGETR